MGLIELMAERREVVPVPHRWPHVMSSSRMCPSLCHYSTTTQAHCDGARPAPPRRIGHEEVWLLNDETDLPIGVPCALEIGLAAAKRIHLAH